MLLLLPEPELGKWDIEVKWLALNHTGSLWQSWNLKPGLKSEALYSPASWLALTIQLQNDSICSLVVHMYSYWNGICKTGCWTWVLRWGGLVSWRHLLTHLQASSQDANAGETAVATLISRQPIPKVNDGCSDVLRTTHAARSNTPAGLFIIPDSRALK